MRLFIATSFPEVVTRQLNELVSAHKPRLPAASWVRPHSQHLTYAFLGEQEESILDRLAPSLEKRLHEVPRFTASLKGCGFFPNPRRARVGWVGLQPEEQFREIAVVVRDEVRRAGIELDSADFKPHLTLMRIRDVWPPASIQMFERAFGSFHSEPFLVDSVTLYSSQLNPNGAIHTPLRKFGLAP